MWKTKFRNIFHKVQQSSSCHQKCRQILYNIYNEVNFEDFEIEFMRCIEIMFGQDALHKNLYADRSLEFAATFVTFVTNSKNENKTGNESENEDSEIETHPLLNSIIRNTLVNHNSAHVSVRYRTCQFINLILRNIGEDAHIENDLWNIILECLLERIKDMKPLVRIQAVRALARLQSPLDSECPVIQAFLERMYDCSPMVRKEIVEVIAPTPLMTAKIVEKVRDADHIVRLAAYRKCSKMGPKMIKLVDRQSVVMNGFNEMHDAVKRCFFEDTLPKWLSAYNGNYLKLLYALKVDAFAEDMKQTEIVCKKVLELFLKTHQLSTIIEYLPIDEDKVIPFEKLNYETALYWSIIVDYLRKLDCSEDYLENVIPELLPFCVYMEKIVAETSKTAEGWKYIQYQHMLHQLILIVGNYDLGDEAGRRALRMLIINMITTTRLEEENIAEMMSILAKLNPVLDSLTIDICSVISDIREPLVAQQPTEEMTRQNDFKVAALRVKINVLKDNCDEAVKMCDYQKAAAIKKELIGLNKQMQELTEQFESERVMLKTTQNDPEMVCRCLNILIGILSYPKLKTLTAALRSCKDEFVMPLCNSSNPEISWRVYKCIALCCTLDEQLAKDSLKLLCSPIILYRLTPQDQSVKPVLLISIAAITDLLRLYGTNIFSSEDDNENTEGGTLRRRLNGTRRLYRVEDVEDSDNFDFNAVTWKDIVDILLDMIDDESGDIREESCKAVCELLLEKIAVSSELLARLILKWFNPLTEKHDQKLQLLLGNTFVCFAQLEGTEEIIERAVIPVLSQLGNAPPTSPLVDIDTDNALRFLSAISSIRKQPEIIDIHKNLAYNLCYKIADKVNDKCVPIYIKMLLNLELSLDDSVIIKELISQVELILEDLVDKVPKRNMQKFLYKLNTLLIGNDNNGQKEAVNENNEENELIYSDDEIIENAKSPEPAEIIKENAAQTRGKDVEDFFQCMANINKMTSKGMPEKINITNETTRKDSQAFPQCVVNLIRITNIDETLKGNNTNKKPNETLGKDPWRFPQCTVILNRMTSKNMPDKQPNQTSHITEEDEQGFPRCPVNLTKITSLNEAQKANNTNKKPNGTLGKDPWSFPQCTVILNRMISKNMPDKQPNQMSHTTEEDEQGFPKCPVNLTKIRSLNEAQKANNTNKKPNETLGKNPWSFPQCTVILNRMTSTPQKANIATKQPYQTSETVGDDPSGFPPCTVIMRRMKNIPQNTKVTDRLLNHTSDRLSKMSMSEISPIKRRKQRGRNSKEADKTSDISETTILHTITESDEIEMRTLLDDNLSIQTPTTTDSRCSSTSSNGSDIKRPRGRSKKVVVSETSSDSDDSNSKLMSKPKNVLTKSSSDTDSSQKKPTRKSLRKKKKQRYI